MFISQTKNIFIFLCLQLLEILHYLESMNSVCALLCQCLDWKSFFVLLWWSHLGHLWSLNDIRGWSQLCIWTRQNYLHDRSFKLEKNFWNGNTWIFCLNVFWMKQTLNFLQVAFNLIILKFFVINSMAWFLTLWTKPI